MEGSEEEEEECDVWVDSSGFPLSVLGGAMLKDHLAQPPAMTGSTLILAAESEEAVWRRVREDVYATNQVGGGWWGGGSARLDCNVDEPVWRLARSGT